jgi:hypothetical protein
MKSRRAISLIELMVIMSASTVALTLTGALLHRAMRIQMHCRAHVDAERTALRLANQFRRDVHATRISDASNAGEGKDAFLRLEFTGDRTAEYSRVASTVVRLESGGGKPVWREEFAFPALTELTIEQENAPQRLILTIAAKPAETPPADVQPLASTYTIPVSIHAEAVVGRNLRFGAAPTGQEAPE